MVELNNVTISGYNQDVVEIAKAVNKGFDVLLYLIKEVNKTKAGIIINEYKDIN